MHASFYSTAVVSGNFFSK